MICSSIGNVTLRTTTCSQQAFANELERSEAGCPIRDRMAAPETSPHHVSAQLGPYRLRKVLQGIDARTVFHKLAQFRD